MTVSSRQGEQTNMAQPMPDEVVYYYDVHPTMEDMMGETVPHSRLVHYLMDVITWLLRGQTCEVYDNLNFYQTSDENEYPLVPDIAIIKGITSSAVNSYRIRVDGPAPQIVFEFASEETWKRDLQEKPGEYASMGVLEYYAYDPNPVMLPRSRRNRRRLFGWQRDRATNTLRELSPDANGRLWSPLLQSYFVPEGIYLRLYDRFGNQRLTQGEEEKQRADAATERALEEKQRADEALRQAETARRHAEALAEKLRALGIDPDQLT